MDAAAAGARRAQRRAARFVAAALFVASQALIWLAYYGDGAKRLIGDEASYQQFAIDILGGGSWMPSTIWPPLQSLVLAAIYAIGGVHVLLAQIVQSLLFVGCALLLRSIWRRVGGVRAANVAAALFLLNPANAAYAHWLWPEVTHLFLVLAVFRLLLTQPVSRAGAAAAGVGTGLALLAKSLLAGFWPAFLIAFVEPRPLRIRWIAALAFGAGLVAATAPALVHGWRETGKPMIADSSVYNLWIGLTDTHRVDYVDDMGGKTLPEFLASGATPEERNRIYLDKVAELVDERGIVRIAGDQLGRQYFRLFSAKTPLVSQLPGPACAGFLSVYRTSPALTGTLIATNDIFHVLMLAGCALGVACWRRRPDLPIVLIALYAGYQIALLSVLHVKARFLFPLVPFLSMFAGSFYAGLRQELAGRDDASLAFTPIRIAAGVALAALLLVLAFAGPSLDGLCPRS
ncbi:MAG TPA: hypothetical protein VJ696_05195 [Rhodanobacteraceae bacterium]|nr:hypothetical protein [Rhodanobacteraceae bacterium]